MQHMMPPQLPNQQQPQLSPREKEALAWREHNLRKLIPHKFGKRSTWTCSLPLDGRNLTKDEVKAIQALDDDRANKANQTDQTDQTESTGRLVLETAGINNLEPGIYRNTYSHDKDKDLQKFNIMIDANKSVRPIPFLHSSTLRKKGFSESMDILAANGHDTLVVQLGRGQHGHEVKFIDHHKEELFMMLKLAERKGLAIELSQSSINDVFTKLSTEDQSRITTILQGLRENVEAQRMMSSAGNAKAFEDLAKNISKNTDKSYQQEDAAIQAAAPNAKADLIKAQLEDLTKRLEETKRGRDEVCNTLRTQDTIITDPSRVLSKRIEELHKRNFIKRGWKSLKENLAFKTDADRMKKFGQYQTPEGAINLLEKMRNDPNTKDAQKKLLDADTKELAAVEKRLAQLTQQVNALNNDPKQPDLKKQVQALEQSLQTNKAELTVGNPNSPKALDQKVQENLHNKKQTMAARNLGP